MSERCASGQPRKRTRCRWNRERARHAIALKPLHSAKRMGPAEARNGVIAGARPQADLTPVIVHGQAEGDRNEAVGGPIMQRCTWPKAQATHRREALIPRLQRQYDFWHGAYKGNELGTRYA